MLNRLFLGQNSQIDITVDKAFDQIKSDLSKKLDNRKTDYTSRIANDYSDVTTKFIYSKNGTSLTIHFSKDMKSKFRNSFQAIYPWFKGTIHGTEKESIIKGRIGIPEWVWWFQIFWFLTFGYIYIGWTKDENSFPDGDIALYFILIGLLVFLVNLVTIRNRVDTLREEIDDILGTVHQNERPIEMK